MEAHPSLTLTLTVHMIRHTLLMPNSITVASEADKHKMWIINFVISVFKNAASRSCCCGARSIELGSQSESRPIREERSYGEVGAYSSPFVREEVTEQELSFSQGYQSFEHSGKALRLCLYHLVVYFLLAAGAYSYVFEKWPLVDSIYFATVTFTTIGYGDLFPTTDPGRLFTVFFSLYGIGILGTFLGIIGKAVLEKEHNEMENMQRRHTKRIMGMFSSSNIQWGNEDEREKEKTPFEEFLQVVLLESPVVALLLLLHILLGFSEGRSVISSIYFAVISATTIGFGDFEPATATMRFLAVFFLPFSVAVFGEVLSRIAGVYMDRKARETEQAFLCRELALRDLQVMDTDKDDKVTFGEFLSFILVALEKVEKSQIDEIRSLFQTLDRDNNGYLNKTDLVKKLTVTETSSSIAGVSV